MLHAKTLGFLIVLSKPQSQMSKKLSQTCEIPTAGIKISRDPEANDSYKLISLDALILHNLANGNYFNFLSWTPY